MSVKDCMQNGRRRRLAMAFSLVEAVLAVTVMAIFLAAGLGAAVFTRVAIQKAKEEAIAMGFLEHYVETVKGLPFNAVVTNYIINPLYDGTGGAPLIRIPPSSAWVSVNTTNFETFHPDLLWLHNRNPALQVTLTTRLSGGTVHNKHLNVRLAWDAPLGHGGRLEQQLDLLRVKDL